MSEVLVEKRGPVQWITINREERRNAMNDAVVLAIIDGLTAATADPAIRAVVLTGAGDRAFCAGADLSAGSGSFRYDYSLVGIPFVRLMKQARDLTLPLIARVNGHTMAGGMGMLGMCDMAIAVDNARFGMPEVKVGVFPMQIMAVLQRLIPNRKLYEMALTGEPISAAEALDLGLVNYVVPAAELDTKVDWLLSRLLDKSPIAIRRGKYAMLCSISQLVQLRALQPVAAGAAQRQRRIAAAVQEQHRLLALGDSLFERVEQRRADEFLRRHFVFTQIDKLDMRHRGLAETLVQHHMAVFFLLHVEQRFERGRGAGKNDRNIRRYARAPPPYRGRDR